MGSRTDFLRQNLGILKVYNVYRNRKGTGTGNFSYFWWYRNRYRKNLVPEKSLGTGIGKIEYRKKVSEPVSRKFGTEKSTGIGIENIWYRIKVSVSVSFNSLGTVTHWYGRVLQDNLRCFGVIYGMSQMTHFCAIS